MADNQYWFARRFPVGHPSSTMSPVTREGWRVVWTFVSWMTGGAIAAVILVLVGLYLNQWWLYVAAAVVYVASSAYGGWYFVTTAMKRGDRTKTVDDYRAGRG